MDAITLPPPPVNEPTLNYAPGSAEREEVVAELTLRESADPVNLTATIGGKKVMGRGEPFEVVEPHRHSHVLGVARAASAADTKKAIAAAADAAPACPDRPRTSRARSRVWTGPPWRRVSALRRREGRGPPVTRTARPACWRRRATPAP